MKGEGYQDERALFYADRWGGINMEGENYQSESRNGIGDDAAIGIMENERKTRYRHMKNIMWVSEWQGGVSNWKRGGSIKNRLG